MEHATYNDNNELNVTETVVKEVISLECYQAALEIVLKFHSQVFDEHKQVVKMTCVNPVLNKSIHEINWSERLLKAFDYFDINTIGDLMDRGKTDFLSIRNIGKKSIKELTYNLSLLGLIFK